PALPLFETFTSIPSHWSVVNPDGLTTWQTTSTPSGKTAVSLDFYDYTAVLPLGVLVVCHVVRPSGLTTLQWDGILVKVSNSGKAGAVAGVVTTLFFLF
ncbi:MAG: hypothetical protein ACKO96_03405, partial [Flammeovirgaceae bacterium]